MPLFILRGKTNVEGRIKEIKDEMKTAHTLSKQYLEGQLYILNELQQKGIEL